MPNTGIQRAPNISTHSNSRLLVEIHTRPVTLVLWLLMSIELFCMAASSHIQPIRNQRMANFVCYMNVSLWPSSLSRLEEELVPELREFSTSFPPKSMLGLPSFWEVKRMSKIWIEF